MASAGHFCRGLVLEMEITMKINSAVFVLFIFGYMVFDICAAEAPTGDMSRLFDVTHYGAVADGKTESSKAFMAAWEEACGYKGNSMLFIPKGTFLVGAVLFSGPCAGPHSPNVLITATLKAPTAVAAFPSGHWIHFKGLQRLTLAGPALLDAQGSLSWSHSSCHSDPNCTMLPTSLKFSSISYATITNITLLNSKGFHVAIHDSDHVNLTGLTIKAPADSPNTDGVHISQSRNVSITASEVGVGDDCVSIGPGSVNVSVSGIRCGPGHGISVGSLGKYGEEKNVEGVTVENCVINGTENGVRVKTWPGDYGSNATGLTFQNIVMVDVSNPIVVDQQYCPSHSCDIHKASSVMLKDMIFKNVTGSYKSQFAVTLICSPTKPCENVLISEVNLSSTLPDPNHLGRLNFKGPLHGFHILNSTF